jgi:hypothetical protein
MNKNNDSWINEFIESFASSEQVMSLRDPRDIVNDYQSGLNRSEQDKINQSNNNPENASPNAYKTNGQDSRSGDKYDIEVKREERKRTREEKQMDRELTVTFTNLNNKDRMIHASIANLCGGRYASLNNESLDKVANILASEIDNILNYVDVSIANYSELIDPKYAIKLAKTVSTGNKISYFDYEKIASKLNAQGLDAFHESLDHNGIKVFYPISSLKIEKEAKYCIDYIKDFKEYKTKDLSGLKVRVASVLEVTEGEVRAMVLESLKQDEILKNIL